MNINPNAVPFVILSAERANVRAAQNSVNSAALGKALDLNPHDYAPVTGRYKGKDEKAYIVLCPQGRRDPAYKLCLQLAARYSQESVLYVNERDKACLEFLPDSSGAGKRVSIGTWRQASPQEAHKAEAVIIDNRGIAWIAE